MMMTQRELARRLRVSQQTVSRALRGEGYVRADLRQRIREAAVTQGYNLDMHYHARVMRRHATGSDHLHEVICVIVDQQSHDQLGFHGRILRGVCDAANILDVQVVTAMQRQAEIPRIVMRSQVDAAVYLLHETAVHRGRPRLPVPWVALMYPVRGVDNVVVDDLGGARELGRHLYNLGHRRLAYIGPETAISQRRLTGLRAGLGAGAELPDELVAWEPWAGGAESALRLTAQTIAAVERSSQPRFTALVAYNDYMAVAAVRHLTGLGLRVPQDVSVTGFDGVLPQELRGPQDLTTAVVPLEDLGAQAVKLLVRRLRNPKASCQTVSIPTSLRIGSTTAPPAVAEPSRITGDADVSASP